METKMLRWTAGVTRLDRVRNDSIRQRFGVTSIVEKLREARLRWYGHVLRASGDSVRKTGLIFEESGPRKKAGQTLKNKKKKKKKKVMRFRVKNMLTIGVTRPISETTMTAIPVFRGTYMPTKVTSDYDDIFRRYLCCLLIKQVPKLPLGLIGAPSLRSIRREEVIELLLSGDHDLHQSIVEAVNAYNRVTKSFRQDYSYITGGPGTSA
ncbi:unnamed protein product [Heligmosomoides polygyrus]|uniref:Polyprotein n=1 Tax=Heligmosomoides polygyrus TaxID=6339 RepID=A0A183FHY3_HELPZ|nr:unnamed protein product [Heligmosomoides polygyrus]